MTPSRTDKLKSQGALKPVAEIKPPRPKRGAILRSNTFSIAAGWKFHRSSISTSTRH